MRRRFNLMVLIVVIFIVASVLIFCFGDSGLLAYRDLQGYEKALSANVASLQDRNRELSAELEVEKSSPERVAVLARSIGLYRPGDKVVRLEGRKARTEVYSVGDSLRMGRSEGSKSAVLKTIAAVAAALLVALALIAPRAARRKAHGSPG